MGQIPQQISANEALPDAATAPRSHTARYFIVTAVLVAGALVALSHYAGFFDGLTVTREVCGPFNVIYRECRGHSDAAHFMMNDVYHFTRDTLRITPRCGFIIYCNKSGTDKTDMLQSLSGVVVDSLPKPPPPPYKQMVIGGSDALSGRFRRRSTFSHATGGYKFISELPSYVKKHGVELQGHIIEMHEWQRRSIRFIAPTLKSHSSRTELPLPCRSSGE